MLFYFSATGITKKWAHLIADRIGEPVLDIETELKKDNPEYALKDDERIGFMCPVYFGDVPEIVRQFVEKIHVRTGEQYYCYIAMTYGSDSFYAPNRFMHLLLRHGLTTSAVFGIRGIDTFLPMFTIPTGSKRAQIEERAGVEAAFVAEQIFDRTVTTHLKRAPFPWLTTACMTPVYAMMKSTRNFHVSESCTGCGLCERNCPVHAIKLDPANQQPQWVLSKCMLCMRCLHNCPAEAIDYGRSTVGKLRYRVIDG